jgi:DNA invertase Pin-like site-specific DNA recombinase
VSRSLPWRRRAQAASLLEAITSGRADFDAIVVGELARGFGSPEQAHEVLAVLDHFNIGLWSPELSGPYDPHSEAHDLLVSAFTGMSKGERRRVQVRVKAAMVEQARTGDRWMGGRPPYGYDLGDGGPHPNPGKAREGKRLHRLVPDPVAAPIVRRMFDLYVNDRLGLRAIAQRLTDDGIPSPSAHDPERNRHRAGSAGAWSQGAVRAILRNPTYTGRMAWGRTEGEERLLDWSDVSLGRERKARHLDPSQWTFATHDTHEAIVDPELFAAAAEQFGHGTNRRTDRRPATKRTYVLRGRIWCAACDRRMEADTAGGRARYRCRLSSNEYARNEELERTHPRSAAVSERRITHTLDPWLAQLFDPTHAEGTLRALVDVASERDAADIARADAARRQVGECDSKLDRYRKALDSGADPAVIGQWIAEVRADRAAAEATMVAASPARMTDDDIAAMVEWLAESADRFTRMLEGDAKARQAFYDALRLEVRYEPGADRVSVRFVPALGGNVRVGGGT